jgi:hypothetical protein
MTEVKEPSPLGKSNSDEPDWNGDDPRIIVRDQAATAVFADEQGDILVWQRDTLGEEARVFLTPENARLVAKAILNIVEPELPLSLPDDLRIGSPKAKGAA